MNATIPNLDEAAFLELKRRAAAEGRDVGQVLNDAMRAYLAQPENLARNGTLRDLVPQQFPEGNEHLSKEIDAIVYGTRQA